MNNFAQWLNAQVKNAPKKVQRPVDNTQNTSKPDHEYVARGHAAYLTNPYLLMAGKVL